MMKVKQLSQVISAMLLCSGKKEASAINVNRIESLNQHQIIERMREMYPLDDLTLMTQSNGTDSSNQEGEDAIVTQFINTNSTKRDRLNNQRDARQAHRQARRAERIQRRIQKQEERIQRKKDNIARAQAIIDKNIELAD